MEYKVIIANSASDLEAKLNEASANGYVIAFVYDPTGIGQRVIIMERKRL